MVTGKSDLAGDREGDGKLGPGGGGGGVLLSERR